MTSGRHSATVRATACEPSSCSSMCVQLLAHLLEALRGSGRVGLGQRPPETIPDGLRDRVQGHDRGEGRQAAQQGGVRSHLADVPARDVPGRDREQALVAEGARPVAQPELVERAPGVDQHVAVRPQAAEHVDLVQQRGVLDDQRIRLGDRLARADLVVVDATEGHDGGASALRAEAGKRLRVAALMEGRERQQLGRGDDALAAAAVDAYLEHLTTEATTRGPAHPYKLLVGSRPFPPRGLAPLRGLGQAAKPRPPTNRRATSVCLAIPGRVVEIVDDANRLARVDIGGVKRTVNVALLDAERPAALQGRWVLVHVGFALSLIDEQEALATLRLLQEMGAVYEQELRELDESAIA